MAADSRVTEKQLEAWLRPIDAVKLLLQAGIEDREQAVGWLRNELYIGRLKAAARYAERDRQGNITADCHAIVPARDWKNIDRVAWKDNFWISGDYRESSEHKSYMKLLMCAAPFDIDETDDDPFEFFMDRTGRRVQAPPFLGFELVGTRFDPAPIIAFSKQTEVNPVGQQISPQTKHAGGRPPKPFWEQLWAAIAAQIYNGDWKPDKQSDIEKAMHNWLALNEESAGETVVRAKAKLLWDALNGEVGN
jgi:hypothetical protein